MFSFPDPGVERLFGARLKRALDAAELRQPDRVPISMPASYLLAEYGGISNRELQDDFDKSQEVLERFALEFEPDIVTGVYASPGISRILGDRMTRWPGMGLPDSGMFQFAEAEFMKAEDYPAFLRDPSDWVLRKYLPRAFSNLEGFGDLPPLGMWAFGYYNLMNMAMYASPRIQAAMKLMAEAVEIGLKEAGQMMQSIGRMAALGFPPAFFGGSLIEAPFDFMSDTLRGMRGIMLDMLQRPEQLLEAEERVLDIQLEHAVQFSAATGLRGCVIPLHRGSDGFMSLPQFERFYWPQLKRLIVGLVARGIMPYVFYEGAWNQRLDYLTELPVGKTVGAFQKTDLFRAKEVIGQTMCIVGGMPNSILAGGTKDQIRELTRELCERVGAGGGYIMAPAAAELGGSNLELVRTWVDATREFGRY